MSKDFFTLLLKYYFNTFFVKDTVNLYVQESLNYFSYKTSAGYSATLFDKVLTYSVEFKTIYYVTDKESNGREFTDNNSLYVSHKGIAAGHNTVSNGL